MKVVIVGGGFVGLATASIKSYNIDVLVYDIDKNKCQPSTIQFNDLLEPDIDIIFICLPTPQNLSNGNCVTSLIENFIKSLTLIDPNIVNKIVIRSTIPPTLCETYNVAHMPEFLTESNPLGTFKATSTWIIGINNNDNLKNKLIELINTAHNNGIIESNTIQICTTRESALIKLARNSFLAMKVSFFNEIYDIANGFDVDYEVVRSGICADKRIGQSHSMVPGHDGFKGYGLSCFPKDLRSLISTAFSVNTDPIILKAVVERNKKDRPEEAKKLDYIPGRSIQ